MTTGPSTLDSGDVARNLSAVREAMSSHRADALFVTSADRYLNEYTPREDNHRYFLSGFTGSTALMIVPRDGKARLFVDGRYHAQADAEVDADLITVEKCGMSAHITGAAVEALGGYGRVAFEGGRLSQRLATAIRETVGESVELADGEIAGALGLGGFAPQGKLTKIPVGISGRSTAEKLAAVFARVDHPEDTVLVVGALDDIAWLTDVRGYHFVHQSSFAARALVAHDEVHVVVPDAVLAAGVPDSETCVHWHACSLEDLLSSGSFDGIRRALYDPAQVTAATVSAVARARGAWQLDTGPSPVVEVKAVKTSEEIAHLESCNDRSARAIVNTVRWVRERLARGERVSELAYFEAANAFYAEQGARDQSFQTIAAVGANSAVIHFNSPSASVTAAAGDMMLLDSGALYEGGFATDITRTFLAGGARAEASPKQKQVYTLVLKGLLRAMGAIVPEGTRGSYLDTLAREPIHAAGLDYAHGTGHGVGIHVHEPGAGLSPSSTLPIRAGHVTSIEPGIYIDGFGGARIENVVVYEPHPEHEGFLVIRPLNFVGYDPSLIADELLEPAERMAVERYHAECERRGTANMDI